jgi:hypothetical protein
MTRSEEHNDDLAIAVASARKRAAEIFGRAFDRLIVNNS